MNVNKALHPSNYKFTRLEDNVRQKTTNFNLEMDHKEIFSKINLFRHLVWTF